MKYMATEQMFTAEKAGYENGMICMILSDKKEVRFPVYLNEKFRNAPEKQMKSCVEELA